MPNPTPTYYAACADNNIIIDTAQGSLIFGFNFNGDNDNNVVSVDATSPYDCCVACQTYAASNGGIPCVNSFLFQGSNQCLLVVGAGCSPKPRLLACTGSGSDCGVSVSNGCNQISGFSQLR